jgi:type II secretory pathway component PulF
MEPDITARLNALENKIDAIYVSTEKTRKYFLTSGIITAVLVLLPAIALVFVIPSFISTYTQNINSIAP